MTFHERAGSTNVIHLHGELTKARPEDAYNEADGFCEDAVINIGYKEICLGDTEGKNHSQLRPQIVFFGEPVPMIRRAQREVADADILLIVGTSLQVYPAAGLLQFASGNCEIFVIDPEMPDGVFSCSAHYIRQKATTGMEEFARRIGFSISDR